MKELTPEEIKLISGGEMRPQSPLAILFDQLGRALDSLFRSKTNAA